MRRILVSLILLGALLGSTVFAGHRPALSYDKVAPHSNPRVTAMQPW